MAGQPSPIGQKNKKGQVYTDPWKMMNDAERTPSFFTGSEVIKEAIRRASCDVMIAYPICRDVSMRRGSVWRRQSFYHDGRSGDDAGHGKFSHVGGSPVAYSNDCDLPRDQLPPVYPTRYPGNILFDANGYVVVACGDRPRFF